MNLWDMDMKTLIIAAVLALYSAAHASPIQVVPPQLQPLAWSLGDWRCTGHYQTVPPFTAAHDVTAQFHVALGIGASWLVGTYHEDSTSDGSPALVIHDDYTLDALGLGTRSFEDSNTGRFGGAFMLTSGGVVFDGTYTIFGQSVGFTETLTRGVGDQSFSTDSRVLLPVGPGGTLVPVTFETQACTRL